MSELRYGVFKDDDPANGKISLRNIAKIDYRNRDLMISISL
jgi:hypothetical protein